MTVPPYRYSDLTFVSASHDKCREYRALLGISDLTWSQIPTHEPQDPNINVLATGKLRELRQMNLRGPYFVEHSGLIVHAWRNLPGGLTRAFLDNVGDAGICQMLDGSPSSDRSATAVTVIALYADGAEFTFEGRVRGRIASEPVGSDNFGWDSIFIPDGQPDDVARTYAQMTLSEKNQASMRAVAAAAFQRQTTDLFAM